MTGALIPPPLQDRPLDAQGRVIGYVIGWQDGAPLQGTNDPNKVSACIDGHLCGLCGHPLEYWIAFIGDEDCVRRRIFTEPPMHEACARYAMTACPYLAAEQFEAKRIRPGVAVLMDRSRPPRMALYVARGYRRYDSPVPPFIPAAKAVAPARLEWF